MPVTPKKSIADVAYHEDVVSDVQKAIAYINQPLILLGFSERPARATASNPNPEPYYLMTCMLPDGDEEILISCGGYLVRAQLQQVNKVEDLPLAITFKKKEDGKTWYLA